MGGEVDRGVTSVSLAWRGPLNDAEMLDLVVSHGGNPEPGWWDKIRRHSLGWVTARSSEEELVGFVNVAWDGSDHAFLIDPKTRGSFQHRGIGTRLVRVAAERAKAAGCDWLHVDFEPRLQSFYFDACGFTPTDAGLIDLQSMQLPPGPPFPEWRSSSARLHPRSSM